MSNFNGYFNIASASLIGFGQDVQFAIKCKNLERTTLTTIFCNFVCQNVVVFFFYCEE